MLALLFLTFGGVCAMCWLGCSIFSADVEPLQQPADTLCQWENNAIEKHGVKPIIPMPRDGQPLRILHLGDSHLQAGILSGKLRSLLSAWSGEEALSEGYVFPYTIMKSNNPSTYAFATDAQWTFDKVTRSPALIDAGLAGTCVTTTEPNSSLTVSITNYATDNNAFDRLTILVPPGENFFEPTIADTFLLRAERHGQGWTFTLRQPVRRVTITLQQNSPEQTCFTLNGMLLEHSASRLVYSAAGLNGASCRTLLRSRHLMAQVAALQPHLLIVSLGTNDAFTDTFTPDAFRDNLNALLGGLRRAAPNCQLLLALAGDHFWQQERSNPNVELVNAALLDYAEQNGCLTWDFYALMGGAGAMHQWVEQGLAAPDLIHLSPSGYRLQAQMLYCALTQTLLQPNN